MEIRNVGVVGCGQMGSGIVQICARSGYRVLVSEISDELLKKGLSAVSSALAKAVEKGKVTQQDSQATLSRIDGTTSLKDFAACDLVIEAAVENLELKKKIFAELDKICPEPAILATNTSCLSITALARATSRPDKVLGLHFFYPAPVMKLLEIVRTTQTSDATVEIARKFGASLGKTLVITPDTPGFIVNRLLMPFILNAIRLLESSAVTREDIDTAINLGLNHPLGPLALADLIGLDTVLFMVNAIYGELKDQQYSAPDLLKKMVSDGRLGRKTGRGFYDYVRRT